MSSGDSGEPLRPMWELPEDPEPVPPPAAEPEPTTAAPTPPREAPLPTFQPGQGFAPPAPDQVRITPPAPQMRVTPPATPPLPTPPASDPATPAPPAAPTEVAAAPAADAAPAPLAPPMTPRPTIPELVTPQPTSPQPRATTPSPAPVPATAATTKPGTGGIAIDVRDLHVTYTPRGRPPVEAVRGLSLRVREGEVLALLGPNGAGKTSTVEVLEGYREPTSGAVRVLGYDPTERGDARAFREQIGIVLQQSEGEMYLTVAETVDRNAGYYPWPYDPDEVIEMVGLTEKANAQVRTLSGGQRRRLDLALGIIGGPRLLFLDEPTTGFDPSARRSSWDLIRSLRELGTTIVLTTHYMDEAQALADRIIVIAKGRIVAEGTPESLGGRATADARIRFVIPPALDGTRVPVSPGDHAELDGFVLTVTTADPTRALHNLTGWALQRGARLESLSVERPTLEDIYLQLVGKEEGET